MENKHGHLPETNNNNQQPSVPQLQSAVLTRQNQRVGCAFVKMGLKWQSVAQCFV